ncbi:hypothetical protein [Neptunicella sp. SCSIO 80796]|uniref:hypothetical protein n=1 Tax=Neptunicella plasticusilytica TaxID=3117012 RepID=UPI003A4D325B
MRIRMSLFLVPALVTLFVLYSADVIANLSPNLVVGKVYGKNITAADIGLNEPVDQSIQFSSQDTERWNLMGRVMTVFGAPVMERFVQLHKIDATEDEINKFNRNSRKFAKQHLREAEQRLVELQSQLAAPELLAESKAKLIEEQKVQKRLRASLHRQLALEANSEMAREFILAWKTEQQMQRIYGGRVIFQQFGPEALDARRQLFEQAEKNGDIRFDNAGVRYLFYYYANMQHAVIDEKALEHPGFFKQDN